MPQPQTFSHFPQIPPPRRVGLVTLEPHPCPYLPNRTATLRAFAGAALDPRTTPDADADPPLVYHHFMDAGFRRSGQMIYQPVCVGCRECVQLRVPVATFEPTKSQRRAAKRNADVTIATGRPVPTREKFELYARYCAKWHAHDEPETPENFIRFLYDSPVNTIEFTYRVGERVIGVGICDQCDLSLSSVYFYFDPAEASRSLGTFSVLREIEFCRERGIPHWYAGFWVRDCPAMTYKANFGPAEVLGTDGEWRPLSNSPGGAASAGGHRRFNGLAPADDD